MSASSRQFCWLDLWSPSANSFHQAAREDPGNGRPRAENSCSCRGQGWSMLACKCEARTGAARSKSRQAPPYQLFHPLLSGRLPSTQAEFSQNAFTGAECRHLFCKALGRRSRQGSEVGSKIPLTSLGRVQLILQASGAYMLSSDSLPWRQRGGTRPGIRLMPWTFLPYPELFWGRFQKSPGSRTDLLQLTVRSLGFQGRACMLLFCFLLLSRGCSQLMPRTSKQHRQQSPEPSPYASRKLWCSRAGRKNGQH